MNITVTLEVGMGMGYPSGGSSKSYRKEAWAPRPGERSTDARTVNVS